MLRKRLKELENAIPYLEHESQYGYVTEKQLDAAHREAEELKNQIQKAEAHNEFVQKEQSLNAPLVWIPKREGKELRLTGYTSEDGRFWIERGAYITDRGYDAWAFMPEDRLTGAHGWFRTLKEAKQWCLYSIEKATKADRRLIRAMQDGENLMNPSPGKKVFVYKAPERKDHEPLIMVRESQVNRLVALGLLTRDHCNEEYRLTELGRYIWRKSL
jgi:hypothetical protein